MTSPDAPADLDEAEERRKLADVIREHGLVPVTSDLEISHVTALLCIGSRYAAKDLATMQSHGISGVVNLSPDVPNYFPETFAYLRLAVEDSPTQRLRPHLARLCDFVEERTARGERVLLHCHAGISRAPAFAAAYLMRARHMSLADAWALVRSARGHVNVTNFERQLARLDISGGFDPEPAECLAEDD